MTHPTGPRAPRRLRLALLASLALVAALALPAGCAKPEPPIGDAKGGIIDWFMSSKSQVEESAQAHCARYGKKGRVVQTTSDKSGGHAIFVCE